VAERRPCARLGFGASEREALRAIGDLRDPLSRVILLDA